MRHPERLRINVSGSGQLVIQPQPAEAEEFAPPRGGELIRELSLPADEREGRRRFEVVVDGWRFEVEVESAARAALRERATRAAQAHASSTAVTLRAQIPGRVVKLWITDGERVEQGQRLLAVEAMKMENEIRAPHAGAVHALRVAVGHKVERGDELLSIT